MHLCAQAMLLFIAGGMTEPMQTLLFLQASIPVTALLSAIFYRTRYGSATASAFA
jgi:hypothetical protein